MHGATEAVDPPVRTTADQFAPINRRPSRLMAAAPFVAAIAVTGWIFRRTIFGGRLPGDLYDARWTVSLHEHWYRVWTGDDAVRNLDFFYPLEGTVGSTDPFLLQGQLHALARAFGAGLIDSWLFAQVTTFLIGAIGVAVLARLVLRTVWAQVALTVVVCASYPMLVQLSHPQTYMYLWLSWAAVALRAIWTRRSERAARCGLVALLLLAPILATSSFYALLLGLVVAVMLLSWRALLTPWRQLRRAISTRVRAIAGDFRSPLVLGAAAASIALWAFAAWLYLPGRDLLPPTQWDDVVLYAPTWSDVFDTRELGGGIWRGPYEELFGPGSDSNLERRLGFTPILLVAFAATGVLLLRSLMSGPSAPRSRSTNTWLLAAWLTVASTVALFLTSEDGFSLYRRIWEDVPGFEAIRAPMRVQVILYGVVAYVVLRRLELWADTPAARRRLLVGVFGCVLAGAVVVEMHRPAYFLWEAEQFLQADLFRHVDEIEERCEAFVLTEPQRPDFYWGNSIEAILLSTLSGVPTPQGYGRAIPIGHPGPSADVATLVEWMRGLGYDGPVCTVTPGGVEQAVAAL